MPPLHVKKDPDQSPWEWHAQTWSKCTACPLCQQRSRVVLARGTVPCDVVFVGEAPGVSENALGKPFCGSAGKLLDRIVDAAMSTCRESFSVAFTNVVACFPRDAKETDDHRPPKVAIEACAPRLKEFVDLCDPRLIVCVGDTAKKWIHLAVDAARDDLLIVHIEHPAAILRDKGPQRPTKIKRCVVTIANALDHLVK